MLTRERKKEIIGSMVEKLRQRQIIIFTKIHGIPVEKAYELRKSLKREGGEYCVLRKTLLYRALQEEGLTVDSRTMHGEVGVALGYGDQVALAKLLVKFSRDNDTFEILSGILKNKLIAKEDIVKISKLPSREVVIGQLVGVLQFPIRGLATVLQGNLRGFVTVLHQVKQQKSK